MLVCLYTCVRFTCVFCLVCLISLGMCYIRWRLCASWIHYQYIRDPGSQIRDPQSWLVNLGSMIQDPRSSILDRRPRVLYTPSRILDPGFRILDHASFILAQDSGSWIQFSESWIQDAGSRCRIKNPGYSIQDIGYWTSLDIQYVLRTQVRTIRLVAPEEQPLQCFLPHVNACNC